MQISKTDQTKCFLYSGTGNTFVLLYDHGDATTIDYVSLAKKLCQQHDVDGLLVMSGSRTAEIKMSIINRDGSLASMCGNGARCAAHWAHNYAHLGNAFLMETGAGILKANVQKDIVKIRLSQPSAIEIIDEKIVANSIQGTFLIDTGVPHAVTELPHLKEVDLSTIGPIVRFHSRFKPKGANATFFEKKGGEIFCRVYERGVEGETQSCGTGSAAAAIIASHRYHLKSPVTVRVQSGDTLSIYFNTNDFKSYSNVDLEGSVRLLSVEGEYQ